MNQTRFTKLFYVLLLFVLVACQAQATSVPTTTTQPPTSAPSTVTPTTGAADIGRIIETIPLPVNPNRDVVYAFGSFWLLDDTTGDVTRWDLTSRQTLATIQVGDHQVGDSPEAPYGDPVAVVATSDSVWVTSVATREIVRIDPGTNQIAERISLARADGRDFVANVMVGDDHNLWVWDYDRQIALRVDLQTKQVAATFTNILPATVADGSLWAWNAKYPNNASQLQRIDPTTDQVLATIPLDNVSGTNASTNNTLWFGHGNDLLGIDPATNQLTAIVHLGARVWGGLFVNGKIWAPAGASSGPPACHDLKQSFLAQIDPITNTVVEKVGLDCPGQMIQVGETLWVFTGAVDSNWGADNFVVVDTTQ